MLAAMYHKGDHGEYCHALKRESRFILGLSCIFPEKEQQIQQYVTIATGTRLSAQNIFFFVGKNFLFHVTMTKKVADRGFLAFWPFESERKFRRKRKNAAKNLKFDKNWVLPSQTPWNIRMHRHHTSYYAGHRFPTINTDRFVIHRCEFSLFLNQTVLFICFITNLLPMQKLSLFRTLRNYSFIASTIASVKRHRVYES